MPNDIEQLKQEFLTYLSVLVFPSPEILASKISTVFPETKLSKIKIKPDNRHILFICNKNKDECYLTKSELGEFGLSIEDFRKSIETIKKENPKEILSEAIKKIIVLSDKKILEIYISLAILTYTNLYAAFKIANPKATPEEIYNCIEVHCLNDTKTVELFYNCLIFTMAFQYPYLDTTLLLETIPLNQYTTFTGRDTCLDIMSAVKKIQLTPYRNMYVNLINSIEKLTSSQVKDKNACNDLVTKLKDLTQICFSDLIQATFYEQTEKFTREKEITKKFRNECNQAINTYQNNHPDEFKKQRGILDRILWLIGKLIPSQILSKEKKMTFFGKKAINNEKKITAINYQLDQLATLNYFSRTF